MPPPPVRAPPASFSSVCSLRPSFPPLSALAWPLPPQHSSSYCTYWGGGQGGGGMCQARPGAPGPDPRHADLGPQFLTMVPLLLDPKRFCAALQASCRSLSVRPSISAVCTGHCVSSARERGHELQPQSSPGRGAASGPHPHFPRGRLHFSPVMGTAWGAPGELVRDLSWGERSLGWGGGGSVTARVTSWCQMPSGGSDQPVRHCGGEGDRGGL